MFWYVMLMLFSPLYLMFGLVFRSEQARLVLALYQQVLILQRQLGKRPSLVPIERLALVLSSLLLGKATLEAAVQAEAWPSSGDHPGDGAVGVAHRPRAPVDGLWQDRRGDA
ncbi:MAG: hypothetical protein IMF16_06290 [Proteobacteria bacterium]|nr:hypothetical protein [Pseudomonadota bacterium]